MPDPTAATTPLASVHGTGKTEVRRLREVCHSALRPQREKWILIQPFRKSCTEFTKFSIVTDKRNYILGIMSAPFLRNCFVTDSNGCHVL